MPPKLIAINHDDHHAEHVGHTTDGRQFFLTTPFLPRTANDAGNEFVALFLFDRGGELLEARIDAFGPRATFDRAVRERAYERHLADLRMTGLLSFGRIEIAPFAVERFGTTFGLIAFPPSSPGDKWRVELHPGNDMAFFEPWDSGWYDT